MATTGAAPLPGAHTQAAYRALAGESRQALLAALRRVGRPVDAGEAGAAVGLHPNTARVHLDLLCAVGLLNRRTEDRSVRGRPRILYAVAPQAESVLDGQRPREPELGYRELARLLARQLSERPDMPSEAVKAGRRWTAVLDKVSLPTGRLSTAETIAVMSEMLSRLGFHPEPSRDGDQIRLHRCPVAEVARESRTVVCGVHLGMLNALIERLDAALDIVGVDPFVTENPSLCVVRLTARDRRDHGEPNHGEPDHDGANDGAARGGAAPEMARCGPSLNEAG